MRTLDDAQFARDLTVHVRLLYRFAVTLTSLDDADDLVQDCLTRAWVKRTQYAPSRGALRSWLLAIMADQARARWRRMSLAVPVGLAVQDQSDRTDSTTDVDLRRAVDALPPRQRTAIVLQHYADLRVEEIAAVMRCSTGTVKSTLSDARRNLSTTLGLTYARD